MVVLVAVVADAELNHRGKFHEPLATLLYATMVSSEESFLRIALTEDNAVDVEGAARDLKTFLGLLVAGGWRLAGIISNSNE